MKIGEYTTGGPACRFGDAHIYYALSVLYDHERMGRRALADSIGIGEGSLRTMIATLKDWDLIDISRGGVAITRIGREFFSSIDLDIVDVPQSEYVVGTFQRGVVVRGFAERVTNGMEQRDTAIIAGADGASVFVVRDGSLIMPPAWMMEEKDLEFASLIRGSVPLDEGDVLIISGAEDPDIATVSAIAAGLGLM